ncbi:MAG: hypothetical protein K6T83_07885 [Alicyclobacillus sp.]|nr:hypothetical protein [Alicyclobacillus sp.]
MDMQNPQNPATHTSSTTVHDRAEQLLRQCTQAVLPVPIERLTEILEVARMLPVVGHLLPKGKLDVVTRLRETPEEQIVKACEDLQRALSWVVHGGDPAAD